MSWYGTVAFRLVWDGTSCGTDHWSLSPFGSQPRESMAEVFYSALSPLSHIVNAVHSITLLLTVYTFVQFYAVHCEALPFSMVVKLLHTITGRHLAEHKCRRWELWWFATMRCVGPCTSPKPFQWLLKWYNVGAKAMPAANSGVIRANRCVFVVCFNRRDIARINNALIWGWFCVRLAPFVTPPFHWMCQLIYWWQIATLSVTR